MERAHTICLIVVLVMFAFGVFCWFMAMFGPDRRS
jgi:hypothetical protein